MKRLVWIRTALVRRSPAVASAAGRPTRKNAGPLPPFKAGKPGRPRKSRG